MTPTTEARTPDPIKPKGIPPRGVCFCRECGHPYYAKREDQEYCSTKCRQNFHRRRYDRGAELYDFAMNWRGKRLKGGFTILCQILDEWLRQEKTRKAKCQKIRKAYEEEQRRASL